MKYIIISLSKGSADEPKFWKPNCAGYTSFPWAAGIYTEDEIKNNPEYFNNGYTTIAVPFHEVGIGLESIGFDCSYNPHLLNKLYKDLKQKLSTDKGYQDFYHSDPANNTSLINHP